MFGTTVFIMVLVLGPQLNMFCARGWQVFYFSKAGEEAYSNAKRVFLASTWRLC